MIMKLMTTSSSSPKLTLGDPLTESRFAAALPAVIRMLDRWHLSRNDQAELLSLGVRSLQRSIQGLIPEINRDQLARLSLISGIFQALHRSQLPESADGWFTRQNDGMPFCGRTPLAYTKDAGIGGLFVIRRLLDQAALGNFESTLAERQAASLIPQPEIDLGSD